MQNQSNWLPLTGGASSNTCQPIDRYTRRPVWLDMLIELGALKLRELRLILIISRKNIGFKEKYSFFAGVYLAQRLNLPYTHASRIKADLIRKKILLAKGKYNRLLGVNPNFLEWEIDQGIKENVEAYLLSKNEKTPAAGTTGATIARFTTDSYPMKKVYQNCFGESMLGDGVIGVNVANNEKQVFISTYKVNHCEVNFAPKNNNIDPDQLDINTPEKQISDKIQPAVETIAYNPAATEQKMIVKAGLGGHSTLPKNSKMILLKTSKQINTDLLITHSNHNNKRAGVKSSPGTEQNHLPAKAGRCLTFYNALTGLTERDITPIVNVLNKPSPRGHIVTESDVCLLVAWAVEVWPLFSHGQYTRLPAPGQILQRRKIDNYLDQANRWKAERNPITCPYEQIAKLYNQRFTGKQVETSILMGDNATKRAIYTIWNTPDTQGNFRTLEHFENYFHILSTSKQFEHRRTYENFGFVWIAKNFKTIFHDMMQAVNTCYALEA